MKKLTLLVAAALMITGGAFAQEKACCKKGEKCHKACCKKDGSKEKETSKSTGNQSKSEPAKPKA